MDIILTLILITFLITMLLSICRWCCRKISKASTTTTMVTTIPDSRISAPYPVQENPGRQSTLYSYNIGPHSIIELGGIPVGMAPVNFPPQRIDVLGFPASNNYPYHNTSNNTPYPPASNNNTMLYSPAVASRHVENPNGALQQNQNQNPPTYAEATGVYERQSAFNPSYK